MRYSKFNECSIVAWSIDNHTYDFNMYLNEHYVPEAYTYRMSSLLWKAEILHSKIAHALFKANTCTGELRHYL
jgi:hypothetical protein